MAAMSFDAQRPGVRIPKQSVGMREKPAMFLLCLLMEWAFLWKGPTYEIVFPVSGKLRVQRQPVFFLLIEIRFH